MERVQVDGSGIGPFPEHLNLALDKRVDIVVCDKDDAVFLYISQDKYELQDFIVQISPLKTVGQLKKVIRRQWPDIQKISHVSCVVADVSHSDETPIHRIIPRPTGGMVSVVFQPGAWGNERPPLERGTQSTQEGLVGAPFDPTSTSRSDHPTTVPSVQGTGRSSTNSIPHTADLSAGPSAAHVSGTSSSAIHVPDEHAPATHIPAQPPTKTHPTPEVSQGGLDPKMATTPFVNLKAAASSSHHAGVDPVASESAEAPGDNALSNGLRAADFNLFIDHYKRTPRVIRRTLYTTFASNSQLYSMYEATYLHRLGWLRDPNARVIEDMEKRAIPDAPLSDFLSHCGLLSRLESVRVLAKEEYSSIQQTVVVVPREGKSPGLLVMSVNDLVSLRVVQEIQSILRQMMAHVAATEALSDSDIELFLRLARPVEPMMSNVGTSNAERRDRNVGRGQAPPADRNNAGAAQNRPLPRWDHFPMNAVGPRRPFPVVPPDMLFANVPVNAPVNLGANVPGDDPNNAGNVPGNAGNGPGNAAHNAPHAPHVHHAHHQGDYVFLGFYRDPPARRVITLTLDFRAMHTYVVPILFSCAKFLLTIFIMSNRIPALREKRVMAALTAIWAIIQFEIIRRERAALYAIELAARAAARETNAAAAHDATPEQRAAAARPPAPPPLPPRFSQARLIKFFRSSVQSMQNSFAAYGLASEARELGLVPRTLNGVAVPPAPRHSPGAQQSVPGRVRATITQLQIMCVLLIGSLFPEVERKRKRALEKRERLIVERRNMRDYRYLVKKLYTAHQPDQDNEEQEQANIAQEQEREERAAIEEEDVAEGDNANDGDEGGVNAGEGEHQAENGEVEGEFDRMVNGLLL